ncbi:MAG TPA: hypothetical protein VFI96_05065 [Longimicrobiaceae bacterium]|nr:hypothetical protein [Longimicrobiaceae bacterium]
MTRDFQDEQGRSWQALAVDEVVAHEKLGARLAFRPADEPEAEPLLANITFNSRQAADFALRTLGVKELRRRLTLAEAAVGGV